jgi:hypothetical protein
MVKFLRHRIYGIGYLGWGGERGGFNLGISLSNPTPSRYVFTDVGSVIAATILMRPPQTGQVSRFKPKVLASKAAHSILFLLKPLVWTFDIFKPKDFYRKPKQTAVFLTFVSKKMPFL